MAFIEANKDDVVDGRRLGVEPICMTLQVASSTYYAARDRPPSRRARRDAELPAAGGAVEGQLRGLRLKKAVEGRQALGDRHRP